MEALRETTGGAFHPHIYLLDGSTLVAYIKSGESKPFYFKSGIKNFDKRGRTFERADKTLFESQVDAAMDSRVEVKGSKGNSYWVDVQDKTCTCPGYTFRGNCKHVEALEPVGSL